MSRLQTEEPLDIETSQKINYVHSPKEQLSLSNQNAAPIQSQNTQNSAVAPQPIWTSENKSTIPSHLQGYVNSNDTNLIKQFEPSTQIAQQSQAIQQQTGILSQFPGQQQNSQSLNVQSKNIQSQVIPSQRITSPRQQNQQQCNDVTGYSISLMPVSQKFANINSQQDSQILASAKVNSPPLMQNNYQIIDTAADNNKKLFSLIIDEQGVERSIPTKLLIEKRPCIVYYHIIVKVVAGLSAIFCMLQFILKICEVATQTIFIDTFQQVQTYIIAIINILFAILILISASLPRFHKYKKAFYKKMYVFCSPLIVSLIMFYICIAQAPDDLFVQGNGYNIAQSTFMVQNLICCVLMMWFALQSTCDTETAYNYYKFTEMQIHDLPRNFFKLLF